MGWNPRSVRVRFSLLLPSVQLLLAAGMRKWAERGPWPKGLDTLYFPTVDLVSRGINAPAVLFTVLADPLYGKHFSPPSVLGLPPERFLFYIGVMITWYLVGRALDQYLYSKGQRRTRMTAAWAIANVLSLALGICFFIGALPYFHNPYQRNDPVGYSALGVLLLVWSAFLVGVPTLRLGKRILRRATDSASG
jgi:hypothetical protein